MAGALELHEPPMLAKTTPDAPWRWLSAGWRDVFRAPFYSLFYGVVFLAAGLAITVGLWKVGYSAAIPAAFACFALAAPVLAMGLYEISRRLEAGERLELFPILFIKTASPLGIAYLSLILMLAVLAWMRIAMLLYALFTSGSHMPLQDFSSFVVGTPQGLGLLIVGTLMGGLIAFFIFAVSVVSFPLLMHRRTDVFTAIAVSLRAVRAAPATMLLWAWLIGFVIAAGVATAFLGLAIAFPLLGHATWHAYRELVPDPDAAKPVAGEHHETVTVL